jgi:hypothetical protein
MGVTQGSNLGPFPPFFYPKNQTIVNFGHFQIQILSLVHTVYLVNFQ